MFYIEIEKNKPVRATNNLKIAENYKNKITTDYEDYSLYNIKYCYDVDTNSIILNPKYEQEKAEQEQNLINNLTITALDFIKVLEAFGLTLEQINIYLDSHVELKTQLTYCQNVYCGVVKQLCPLTVNNITITAKMVEDAFKAKNNF